MAAIKTEHTKTKPKMAKLMAKCGRLDERGIIFKGYKVLWKQIAQPGEQAFVGQGFLPAGQTRMEGDVVVSLNGDAISIAWLDYGWLAEWGGKNSLTPAQASNCMCFSKKFVKSVYVDPDFNKHRVGLTFALTTDENVQITAVKKDLAAVEAMAAIFKAEPAAAPQEEKTEEVAE